MTLLEAVQASILAHLKLRVDPTARSVISFYESEGDTVILYTHTGPTRDLKRHVFPQGIRGAFHLMDLDLTGES